jgi:hypothetical protein
MQLRIGADVVELVVVAMIPQPGRKRGTQRELSVEIGVHQRIDLLVWR